jgi:hypothetical protein
VGKRGPKPQPIEVLEARGSREPRVKQKELASLPDLAPVPRADYPINLTVMARPYYDGICAHLESIKRLRGAFVPGMVELSHLLCDLDRLRLEQNRLEDPELELSTKDRILLESRIIIQKDTVGKAVHRLMREYYMTPASLEGVAVEKDKPKPVENEPIKAPLRRRK